LSGDEERRLKLPMLDAIVTLIFPSDGAFFRAESSITQRQAYQRRE
jgi:hypothetical protein